MELSDVPAIQTKAHSNTLTSILRNIQCIKKPVTISCLRGFPHTFCAAILVHSSHRAIPFPYINSSTTACYVGAAFLFLVNA